MTPVYFYHPNPGAPAQWKPVIEIIEKKRPDLKGVSVDSDNPQSLSGSGIVIGYSQGAYRAIKDVLTSPGFSPSRIILIAPYLESTDHLSAVVYALLQVPLLGNKLLGSKVDGIVSDFFAKNFPYSHAASLAPNELAWFKNVETWQKATTRKYNQQKQPLSALKPTNRSKKTLQLLYFKGDTVATPIDRAAKLLAPFFGPKFEILTAEGLEHGALWSQPETVAAQILGVLS